MLPLIQSLLFAAASVFSRIRLVLPWIIPWLLWRFWRFSLRPWLNPSEPKQLPYMVPGLGHTVAFFNGSNELFERAKLQVGHRNEPYGVQAAGCVNFIVTDVKEVSEVYRNTETLSFQTFIKSIMRGCGASAAAVDLMYTVPPESNASFSFANPRCKPLAVLTRDLHIRQLMDAENLKVLSSIFLRHLDRAISPEGLCTQNAQALVETRASATLLRAGSWIDRIFVLAGQEAYWGHEMQRIDPELVDTFIEFDDLSWQMLYQYPRVLSHRMFNARDRLIRALDAYFSIPQEERRGEVWFTKAEEDEMRAIGLNTKDIAALMLPIYWGLNTNSRKVAYWLLSYILQDKCLFQKVRHEIRSAIELDTFDVEQVMSDCPLLNSVYHETLRMTASSASVRLVTKPTTVGKWVYPKGSRIIVPFQHLHMNGEVFGEQPESFHAERFLGRDDILSSSSWKPFGGGRTVCPGRFLAKRAVLMFVSLLMLRFDIDVPDGQKFPLRDATRPTLGIVAKEEGSADVVIGLTAVRDK